MIRRANVNDYESIGNILYQVNALHAKGRPDIFIEGTKKFSDEELKDILSDDKQEFYVYEVNDKICAYVCVEIHEYERCESRFERKELYIEDLCVDEKYRHQGIASELFEYVKELAKEKGCGYLTLNVWKLNEGAQKFYEKMGMKPLKIIMETIL